MNIFFLIFLGIIQSVLAGGSSSCEPLTSNFLALYHVCETIFERSANLTVDLSAIYPELLPGYFRNLIGSLNFSAVLLAAGTSEYTSVSHHYIDYVFNDLITPPLVSPLSCIENELLSFYPSLNNFLMNAHLKLPFPDQSTPIDANTPCSTIISYIQAFYLGMTNMLNVLVTNTLADAADFKNIGKLDLYQRFIPLKMNHTLIALIYRSAELLNINAYNLADFIADQSVTIPDVMICVKDVFLSAVGQVKLSYDFVISRTTVPTGCDPFYTDFIAFQDILMTVMDDIQNFALNSTIANPILAPAFKLFVDCTTEQLLMLTVNATSGLSDINSEEIYNFLKGITTQLNQSPLDCVTDDLIYIRDRFNFMINQNVAALLVFKIDGHNYTSCVDSYAALTPYYDKLVELLHILQLSISKHAESFAKINMSNLYTDLIIRMNACLFKILGTGVGAVLNTTPTEIIAFLSAPTTPLTFPYDCVKTIVNSMKSILGQAHNNYMSNVPLNLIIPPIPSYNPTG